MKIRIMFSLSSLAVMVLLLACAVLLPNVSSFVIPFSGDDSHTVGLGIGSSGARNDNQLDQNLDGAGGSGSRIGSREKRWAIPVDVQDIPCELGQTRRPDGKCQVQERGDDYGSLY